MVHYPKRLDRPLAEVLADRQRRKDERAARERRPPKIKPKKLVFHCDASTRAIHVAAPLTRKNCHEIKDPEFTLRIVKTNRFDRVHVDVKQPTRFYIDWFWNQLQIASPERRQTLLDVFPNSKEVTESCAAFFAAGKLERRCTALVVGDGSTPRTATVFAPFSPRVVSVDPILNPNKWSVLPDNLEWRAQTIQAWVAEQKQSEESVIVVAVHAHVAPDDYVGALSEKRNVVGVVTIECCVPQTLAHEGFELLYSYDDWGIHSPCRAVRVWAAKGNAARV